MAIWFTASPSYADSWLPPKVETYYSPSKAFRLRITPRALSSALGYFSDKVNGREPAGAPRDSKQVTARATFERREETGTWVTVWEGALTNEIAPVDALISDNGQIVTFDNWHSMGYGSNVIAIYDQQGAVVRTLALSDFLPSFFIEALPHSVSSIHWRGQARLADDGSLVIPIVVPRAEQEGDTTTYVDAVIRLADGNVVSGTSPDWQAALAEAQTKGAIDRSLAEQAEQEFASPLLGPKENTERAWHDYLREAFFRTAADWADNIPATTVLRDPSAPDYAASEAWLRDDLLATDYPKDVIAIASIAPTGVLIERMRSILARSKPGRLKGVRIYVAAPSTLLPVLKGVLDRTGAEVACFDPEQPIPQRPERMRLRSAR